MVFTVWASHNVYLDECHNEVKPSPTDATDYYNYKGWYSIVLLAVVDYRLGYFYDNILFLLTCIYIFIYKSRYRFLYVNIGAPGRCNDSQIYNASLLKQMMDHNELLTNNKMEIGGIQMPICIIGDSAFRFSTSLMKPYAFSLALTETQKLFNYKLSKCRRVVENAFGHLKAENVIMPCSFSSLFFIYLVISSDNWSNFSITFLLLSDLFSFFAGTEIFGDGDGDDDGSGDGVGSGDGDDSSIGASGIPTADILSLSSILSNAS
uniref:Glucan endo-1,3-beta-glucosidase 11 n=1 Tax=Zeugodacus cucurbitae TaxID=28588 RepID=A0A0A1WWQ2_ZEUCU